MILRGADHRNGYRGAPSQLDYAIAYPGKEAKSQIIAQTLAARLIEQDVVDGPGACHNRLIHGDNLPVLRALLDDPLVCGKIRLVYIDPPFGTQLTFVSKQEEKAYRDAFTGARYLDFLRRRLILLRELLAQDGSIYIHLDNKMAFAVKVIMDEVFGPRNFRNWIARKKCNPKNYTRRSYGNLQDFVLFYTKSSKYVFHQPRVKQGIYTFEERFPHVEPETGRRYALVPIYARGIRNGATGQPWRGMLPPPGKHWQVAPSKLDEFDARGEIYWSPTGNPRRKIYSDERAAGVAVQDIWLEFQDERNQMIETTGYPTEKNIDLLKRIVRASSNEGDLVLDCFVGSGTTLVAAGELGRYWIGVDSADLAISVTRERLGLVYRRSERRGQLPLLEEFPEHKTLGYTVYEAKPGG